MKVVCVVPPPPPAPMAMNGLLPVTVCVHVLGLVVPDVLVVEVSSATASTNGAPKKGTPPAGRSAGTHTRTGTGRSPPSHPRTNCSASANTDSHEWQAYVTRILPRPSTVQVADSSALMPALRPNSHS